MRETQTEVLVVGAGPVGLWTALLLTEAGVQVTIIDREERVTARSYACALHSNTLQMFQRLGLADELLARGRRVQRVGFYDEHSRRAELDLSALGGPFPFLLILPQSALEGVLEQRLKRAGVTVHWNYRFDDFREEPELVVAAIEKLEGTGTGYIVPHWETMVKSRASLRAQFIIGADGQNSMLRQRLGIELERVAGISSFAAYEFEAEQPVEDELRVVLSDTTNALWPLPGNRCRWTFQLVRSEMPGDFPEKERRSARLVESSIDEKIRQYVEKVAERRAPWFKAKIREIAWCTEVAFEQRVARQFGRNRCWLAGDAAHQTGPVGVQSMNAGFAEGERLAGLLRSVLRREGSAQVLHTYDREQREQWRRLLGQTGGPKARNDTDPWVREHAARILPCLPGSGPDPPVLAAQLKLDFA
jgi:2-polyprenyl-6-methoxyphenol hydroxylase-like FAD-dependent oxidoreductase